jgi:hypothetical protein
MKDRRDLIFGTGAALSFWLIGAIGMRKQLWWWRGKTVD